MRKLLKFISVFLLILTSCSSSLDSTIMVQSEPVVNPRFRNNELKSAQNLWTQAGILSYRFTFEIDCFCIDRGPFQVTVNDGIVDKVSRGTKSIVLDNHSNVDEEPDCCPASSRRTAEDLFQLIRSGIGDGQFVASYDAITGFPIRFYSEGSPNIIDDEFGFQTYDFHSE